MPLEVGFVARSHGLRGQVVVELLSNRDERLAPGATLDAGDRTLAVVASSPIPASRGRRRWIVSFAGVDDRPAADALRGITLHAEPLSDPDALWVHELIGAVVLDTSGATIGTVSSVEANPASDLLVLEDGTLIPLRFVTASDASGLTVDVPDGLLDL